MKIPQINIHTAKMNFPAAKPLSGNSNHYSTNGMLKTNFKGDDDENKTTNKEEALNHHLAAFNTILQWADFPKITRSFMEGVICELPSKKIISDHEFEKILLDDNDFPMSMIPSIMKNLTNENTETKFEIYKLIKENKEEFGSTYDECAGKIVLAADKDNIETIKEIFNFIKENKKEFGPYYSEILGKTMASVQQEDMEAKKEIFNFIKENKQEFLEYYNRTIARSLLNTTKDNIEAKKEAFDYIKRNKTDLGFDYKAVLSSIQYVDKENFSFLKTMINNEDFRTSSARVILSETNQDNIELGFMMVKDKSFPQNLIKYILSSANKDNFKLAKKLIEEQDFPRGEIAEILSETNAGNVNEKCEMLKRMRYYKHIACDDYQKILTGAVKYINRDNFRLGEKILYSFSTPIEKIGDILGQAKPYNIELLERIVSDKEFPKDNIKHLLSCAREQDIQAKEEIYDFVSERQKEFGKKYSDVLFNAVKYCNEHNLELCKGLLSDEDFSKDKIGDVLKNTNWQTGQVQTEFYKIIREDKNNLKGFYKNILHNILPKIEPSNIDLAVAIITDKNFPKSAMGDFLQASEKYWNAKITQLYRYQGKNIANSIKHMLKRYGNCSIQFENFEDKRNPDMILKSKVNVHKPNLEKAESVLRLNDSGDIFQSVCETYKVNEDDFLDRIYNKDNKIECETYYYGTYSERVITAQRKYLRDKDNSLIGIVDTTQSIMPDFYDITYYDLRDVDEKSDYNQMIEKGKIQGKKLARTFVDYQGTKTHIENFVVDNFVVQESNSTFNLESLGIKRIFSEDKNGIKNLSMEIYDDSENPFAITQNNNFKQNFSAYSPKTLFKIENKFETKSDGTTVTTIDNKEYISEFNDEEKTVKVNEKTIKLNCLLRTEDERNKEILWNIIKKSPANLILDLLDLTALEYEYNNPNADGSIVRTNESIGVFAHELGHVKDMVGNGDYYYGESDLYGESEIYSLAQDADLISLYKEEMKNAKKLLSENELEDIKYYSFANGFGGLKEIVADVYSLCTTHETFFSKTRLLYLLRYFPKTVVRAANLLWENY